MNIVKTLAFLTLLLFLHPGIHGSKDKSDGSGSIRGDMPPSSSTGFIRTSATIRERNPATAQRESIRNAGTMPSGGGLIRPSEESARRSIRTSQGMENTSGSIRLKLSTGEGSTTSDSELSQSNTVDHKPKGRARSFRKNGSKRTSSIRKSELKDTNTKTIYISRIDSHIMVMVHFTSGDKWRGYNYDERLGLENKEDIYRNSFISIGLTTEKDPDEIIDQMRNSFTKDKYDDSYFNCIDFVTQFIERLIGRDWPEYEWPEALTELVDKRIDDMNKRMAGAEALASWELASWWSFFMEMLGIYKKAIPWMLESFGKFR